VRGVWLSTSALPWDGVGDDAGAPVKLSMDQLKLAARSLPKGEGRMQALLAQLQPPPQRPIALYQYQQPVPTAGGMALAVSSTTIFEPAPYHFKIPHGIFMREATAVAVDSRDYVYVFNRGNMPILVFDTDGNLVDFWGNPTPNKGTVESPPDPYGNVGSKYIGTQFARPHAITIDHEDNLWLTDDVANTITKCDRSGRRMMMICSGGVVLTGEAEMKAHIAQEAPACVKLSGGVGFNRPTDACVDPKTGDIFITDGYGNARVHHFTATGKHVKSWGTPGTDPGEFNLPHNVAMHPDGDKIIVADRENNRAQVFSTSDGKCVQVIPSHRCVAVAVDPLSKNIFLAEQASHSTVQQGGYMGNPDNGRKDLSGWTPNIGCRVTVHSPDGERVALMGGVAGEEPDQFTYLHSVATDSKGNMLAAEVSFVEIGRHVNPQRECMSLRMWRRVEN
jgi:DNA-binding beta-propeller fold protein YncE